jgi:NitT/TauT family transport system permease protein
METKVKLFKMGGSSDFGKLTPVISAIGIIIILGVWWLISYFGVIPAKILPNPIDVITSFGSLFTENHLVANAWYSIKLNLMSYVWAIVISLPLGFIIALYPAFNVVLGRYINSVRFLPVPAISGIFIAIFGLTTSMKEAFLAFALLIYILPEVANKVNDLQNPVNEDNVYLQTLRTLGATNWQKFKYVYWPYVTSNIADSIRNLLAVSWSYVVIAELLYKDGGISGIGALINTMIRQSCMPAAYALLVLVIVIGCLQDYLFGKLFTVLFPFKYNKKSIFYKS